MCAEGVRSILLLPLMARCLETIDVCIWRMFVFMSPVMTVWGSVGMFVVCWPLLKIVFFSIGVLKYAVCLCRGCDGCCVFCLYCEAWSCRCSCMRSVSVSSCRWFVSCVHPYGRGILQSRSHDFLVSSHEYLLLFTPSCFGECFFIYL